MSLTRPAGEFAALLDNLRDFIDNEVIPREDLANAHDGEATQRIAAALQVSAKARGLGAPRMAIPEGGLGLSWEECCAFLEQAGRSFLGPVTLQCAPPGQPDVAALDKLASPAQRQRYLAPLARGDKRSCFAMTEPAPGAGSDPRMLSTPARRVDDGWVIDGHKWFITGGMRADFAIVVARTDGGVSWLIVDKGTPGTFPADRRRVALENPDSHLVAAQEGTFTYRLDRLGKYHPGQPLAV